MVQRSRSTSRQRARISRVLPPARFTPQEGFIDKRLIDASYARIAADRLAAPLAAGLSAPHTLARLTTTPI